MGHIFMMLAERLSIVVVTYNSMKVLPSFLQHLENALDGEQCRSGLRQRIK